MPPRIGRYLACLLVAASSLTSSAQASSSLYVSGFSDVDVPIPDNDGNLAVGTISIEGAPAGAVVTGVDVEWSVIHTYSGDLLVWLADPGDSAQYVLWNYEGEDADDPYGSAAGVTDFNGLPVEGDWHLKVYDYASADVGYLDSWSITIYYEVPAPGAFTLTAESPYCDQRDPATPAVSLSWATSPGALTYDVYRDGALLVSDLTVTTLLDVFGLAEGTQHSYFVRAHSASASADSNTVLVSIGDVCVDGGLEVEVGPETALATAQVQPEAPRVVFGPNGIKAVVWFQSGAGANVIRAQLFDAQGQPLTAAIRVDQVAGDNRAPTPTFDDQGNLLVLWTRDEATSARYGSRLGQAAAQGSSVVGRGFTQTGQPLSGESVVSTSAAGESATPESDSDRSGNSVAVWQDGSTIRARMLDPQGSPRSAVFDVNPGGSGSQPSIAVSASGDFVIAWRDGGSAIAMRRYRDDGQLLGGEQVSQAGAPANPAVAIDDAGNAIVVWDAVGVAGRDIYAQRYLANGNRRGVTSRMNAGTTGDQTRPRVDVNAKGRFAVVWESTTGAPGSASVSSRAGQSTLGRVFTAEGQPEHTEVEIATTEAAGTPEKPDVSVNDKDDVAVVYERRGGGGQSAGVFSKDIDVTAPAGTCVPDDTTLCLNDGRFRVTALWEEPNTRAVDTGHAVSLTADTGYFWFFGSDNVEVVVKTLAACPVNARFWVFAAGLTNVEVTLRVDDVVSGESQTYFNERGAAFLPVLDSDAFATCDAASLPAVPLDEEAIAAVRQEVLAGLLRLAAGDDATVVPSAPPTAVDRASSAACANDADSLCLAGSRFQVEVQFLTGSGQSGNGQATALTQDTGYFWFFDPANVEIVVKVLNACTISNRFWVFAAGLTDVEARITVIDTNTGARREYLNSLGTPFAPIQDTDAFATCP